MRAAAILADGDCLCVWSGKPALRNVIEIGTDIIAGDDPARQRVFHLADMVQHGPAVVHKQRRARESRVIHLAHVGAEGADQVQMLARLQPRAFYQRRAAHGGGADDIRTFNRALQIRLWLNACDIAGELRGTFKLARPNRKLRLWKQGAVGIYHAARHCARADKGYLATVRARQHTGGKQAVACGFPLRDKVKIQQCL